jgi:hypothetical protein
MANYTEVQTIIQAILSVAPNKKINVPSNTTCSFYLFQLILKSRAISSDVTVVLESGMLTG